MRKLPTLPLSVCVLLLLQHIKGDADGDRKISNFVASLSADTFYQTGGKSKEDHTGEQCSKSCKLVTSPYEGEPDQLSGQCGCVAPHRACSAEFNEGVVRELCDALGNRAFATAFTDSEGAMAAGAVRRLQKSKDLSLLATAECWQGSENLQAVCEVLLEEASWPLLHALRKACSKNIKFSHCALSFGDQAPLRSEQCFTSNQTDSAGASLYAVGRVASAGPAGASTPLTFSAHYDNHWDFTTHELRFVLKSSGVEAAGL